MLMKFRKNYYIQKNLYPVTVQFLFKTAEKHIQI